MSSKNTSNAPDVFFCRKHPNFFRIHLVLLKIDLKNMLAKNVFSRLKNTFKQVINSTQLILNLIYSSPPSILAAHRDREYIIWFGGKGNWCSTSLLSLFLVKNLKLTITPFALNLSPSLPPLLYIKPPSAPKSLFVPTDSSPPSQSSRRLSRQISCRTMPPSSDPAVPTVTPVTISYSELQVIHSLSLQVLFVVARKSSMRVGLIGFNFSSVWVLRNSREFVEIRAKFFFSWLFGCYSLHFLSNQT